MPHNIMMDSAMGMAAGTLLVVCVVLWATRAHGMIPSVRLAVAGIVCVVLWLPLAGVQLISYVRGTIGDLSVTTLCLLVLGCWNVLGGRTPQPRRQIRLLLLGVLAAGLTLYPWSLGVTMVDPYSWGYGSYVLVGVLSLFALFCWLREAYMVVTVLLLASSAYLLGLGESTNLWDYLVDPLIMLFALARLGVEMLARARGYLSRRVA